MQRSALNGYMILKLFKVSFKMCSALKSEKIENFRFFLTKRSSEGGAALHSSAAAEIEENKQNI